MTLEGCNQRRVVMESLVEVPEKFKMFFLTKNRQLTMQVDRRVRPGRKKARAQKCQQKPTKSPKSKDLDFWEVFKQ